MSEQLFFADSSGGKIGSLLAFVSVWWENFWGKQQFWRIISIIMQVIGIYGYTIFAIQQERFLDDFDMPEEIDRTKKDEQ